jgi:hypothetical protein
MKAAGFEPPRRETLREWALRMIEQGRKIDVLTLDSCANIDWNKYEETYQHCKETERE